MIVEITLKLWKDPTNSLAIEHVISVGDSDMLTLQQKLSTKIEASIADLPTALVALESMIDKEQAGNVDASEFNIKYGSLTELVASAVDPKITH